MNPKLVFIQKNDIFQKISFLANNQKKVDSQNILFSKNTYEKFKCTSDGQSFFLVCSTWTYGNK